MVLIYKDEIGITLNIYCTYNIVGYTSVTVDIVKPDGTVLIVTPSVVDATIGKLSYDTVSGDLDQIGEYTVQPIIVFGGGDTVKGEIDKFIVNMPVV